MTDDGVVRGEDGIARCWWCGADPLHRGYHDDEWGRPSADDMRLFENLCLEGFQSGLSWWTILRKRESFRRAFSGFEIESIAGYGSQEIETLMANAGIVRNRAKIVATINNARHYPDIVDEFGSLAAYVWRFEQGAEARALSKDLRRRGWSFVGPTIVYSFMQAMGLVNDHVDGCDFRRVVEAERAAFQRPAGS